MTASKAMEKANRLMDRISLAMIKCINWPDYFTTEIKEIKEAASNCMDVKEVSTEGSLIFKSFSQIYANFIG